MIWTIIQLVISGIAMGFVYALIGIEYTLIYNASGVLNFSHDKMVSLGAYIYAGMFVLGLGWNSVVSAIASLLLMAVFGILVAYLIFIPLRKQKSMIFTIMATIMFGKVIMEGACLIWGGNAFTIPDFMSGTYQIGNAVITSSATAWRGRSRITTWSSSWPFLWYSRSDCEDIANVLLASDRMGIESHGVQRMKLYTHSLEIGRIKRGAKSEIVRETPVSAVIDAHDAIGQPVSVAAMQMAIDKAKKAGVGIVVVRDSNHYGIAGYYAKMAADQGLLGISMTNTEALVVPTFGKQPMMGTNPIAVSMPGTPHPFHLDMATSVVPAGKMEVYAKAGKTLPGDWLMNSDGSPSYDPNDFLRIRATKSLGGIFPVGGEGETNSGHKGYGLSLLVELFCGILSGGRTSNEVRVVPNVDKVCHFFMAVDYSIFGDKEQMEKRFSQYLEDIRNSALADGQTRIYTHGDKAYAHMARVAEEGVKVNDKTYDEIVKICQDLGIDPAEYLIEKAGPQA